MSRGIKVEDDWNARQREIEEERERNRPAQARTIREPSGPSRTRTSMTPEEHAEWKAKEAETRKVGGPQPRTIHGVRGVVDGRLEVLDFDDPAMADKFEADMAKNEEFQTLMQQERYKRDPSSFWRDWTRTVEGVFRMASANDMVGLRDYTKRMDSMQAIGNGLGIFAAAEVTLAKALNNREVLGEAELKAAILTRNSLPDMVRKNLNETHPRWNDVNNPGTVDHAAGFYGTTDPVILRLATTDPADMTPAQADQMSFLSALREAGDKGTTLAERFHHGVKEAASVGSKVTAALPSADAETPHPWISGVNAVVQQGVYDAAAQGRRYNAEGAKAIVGYFARNNPEDGFQEVNTALLALPGHDSPEFNAVVASIDVPGLSGTALIGKAGDLAQGMRNVSRVRDTRILAGDEKAVAEIIDSHKYLEGVRQGLFAPDQQRTVKAQGVMDRYSAALSGLSAGGDPAQFAVRLQAPETMAPRLFPVDGAKAKEAEQHLRVIQGGKKTQLVERHAGLTGDKSSMERFASELGDKNSETVARNYKEVLPAMAAALDKARPVEIAPTEFAAVEASISRETIPLDDARAREATDRLARFDALFTGPLGVDIARSWQDLKHSLTPSSDLRSSGSFTINETEFALTDVLSTAEREEYIKSLRAVGRGARTRSVEMLRSGLLRGVRDGNIVLDAQGFPKKTETFRPYAERAQEAERSARFTPRLRLGPDANTIIDDVVFDMSNPADKAALGEILRLGGSSKIISEADARQLIDFARADSREGLATLEAARASRQWLRDNGVDDTALTRASGSLDTVQVYADAAVLSSVLAEADPVRFVGVRAGLEAQAQQAQERKAEAVRQQRLIESQLIAEEEQRRALERKQADVEGRIAVEGGTRQEGREALEAQRQGGRIERDRLRAQYATERDKGKHASQVELVRLRGELAADRAAALEANLRERMELASMYNLRAREAGHGYNVELAEIRAQLSVAHEVTRSELATQRMHVRAELEDLGRENKWKFKEKELTYINELTSAKDERRFNRELEKLTAQALAGDERARMLAEYRLLETAVKIASSEDSFFDSGKYRSILQALSSVRKQQE